jgi:L-aspartate oxidase
MITGLVIEAGRCVGVHLLDHDNVQHTVYAKAVLLASGGAGQVYSDTTNPSVATGDGISVVFEAGVELADMEFYQFHPTALSLPGVPRFLMSEALRGEGAYLVNDKGERFMERYHPLLELAPRDVVARAITREGFAADPHKDAARPVYLDMRHVERERSGLVLAERFPGISAFLAQHNLYLKRDPIPVRPAAHYLMGGVRTDVDTRTSMPGLFAAGEVACTGVHGANRLASNSLLEGLVFGARAAKAMREEKSTRRQTQTQQLHPEENPATEEFIGKIRTGMWKHAGLLRDEALLSSIGLDDEFAGEARVSWSRRMHEAHSLYVVAQAIVESASARQESRGAHYRSDFPKRDDRHYGGRHSVLSADSLRFVSKLDTFTVAR